MSLHKLTPGDGYTYLTRQVAAPDATHVGHIVLGDLYASKGESPGLWTGSGLSSLAGVDAGDPVTPAQMKALFGQGWHPNADTIGAAMVASGGSRAEALRASRLGRAFGTYQDKPPLPVALSQRFIAHNMDLGLAGSAKISADVRTRIREEVGAQMFADAHGRPPADQRELYGFIAGQSLRPRTAVAGYGLTFSPVKSVSSLWAVASPEVATLIMQAHEAAIANTLGWLERDAIFTRTGAHSRSTIEVTGLIAAAFTHRDTRSGDPDLHTHVVIANKVQGMDGGWRSMYGRVLFKASVAASERYNTRIEAELIAALGVRFEARPGAGIGKRPIREIVGVSAALNTYWSSRRADIAVRVGELSSKFLADHGRTPTAVELLRLDRRSHLDTRAAKHSPRSYADQRTSWRAQAARVLGSERALEAMITLATGSSKPARMPTRTQDTAMVVTGAWVTQTAAAVVAKVAVSHPTWQMWHVRAEAERAARTAGAGLADVDGAVDAVVAAALSPANALALAGPEPARDQGAGRRRDGSSVYSIPGAARFTSLPVLAAKEYSRPAPPPRNPPTGVAEVALVAPDEALFHAARQREYSPAPDLEGFDTERQLVEANKWDHAPVPQARLLALNELAADFFAAGYAHSWGPQYLRGRLGTDLVDHPAFRIGYAPAGWTHLSDHLRDLGASDTEILAAGLGRFAGNGAIIDQFRGRLVVPIRNGEQIHGFIGRRHPAAADHGKAGPKYLNTARTDLFDKGAQLFGLTEGRAALDAGATPVLVEGFFDALAVTLGSGAHYVGLACLGTSITPAQADLLRPYAGAQRPGVTVATDADLAGKLAAERVFWMLSARGDTPRHVLLPEGQDPAAVLHHGGPGSLLTALEGAQPLARALLDERLRHLREPAQLVPACAAIIAAAPPQTWTQQIDYAAARTSAGRGVLQQAVADAATRWTLDPLGSAQSQIADLRGVRTRLQRSAELRACAEGPRDLPPVAGSAAGQSRADGLDSATGCDRGTASPTSTPVPAPGDAWLQLVGSINPALTAGDDWPMLWRAIQEAELGGHDVAGELARLATAGKLSTRRPATELAYRLRAATAAILADTEATCNPAPKPAAAKSTGRPHPAPRSRPLR